jgi:hypothetical protein
MLQSPPPQAFLPPDLRNGGYLAKMRSTPCFLGYVQYTLARNVIIMEIHTHTNIKFTERTKRVYHSVELEYSAGTKLLSSAKRFMSLRNRTFCRLVL